MNEWVRRIHKERGYNKAAVAVANKNARFTEPRDDKETEREYHQGPSKLKQFLLIEWPGIRMHIFHFSLNEYLRKRMSPYTLPIISETKEQNT
jgi:hypothetical protein